MLTIILVGTLFIGAFALLLISVGNARIPRQTRDLKHPVEPVGSGMEVRLMPRHPTPSAG